MQSKWNEPQYKQTKKLDQNPLNGPLEDADENMGFDASVELVMNRALVEIAFQNPEAFFDAHELPVVLEWIGSAVFGNKMKFPGLPVFIESGNGMGPGGFFAVVDFARGQAKSSRSQM